MHTRHNSGQDDAMAGLGLNRDLYCLSVISVLKNNNSGGSIRALPPVGSLLILCQAIVKAVTVG